MKKCYLLSILLLIIISLLLFFSRKKIKKVFFPEKKIYISKLVSHEDKKLIRLLNKALADEWLAYYQYWIGSKVVKGKLREETVHELIEHANDEKKHADMLVPHILKLGGIPILEFRYIRKISNCDYIAPPSDGDLKLILMQNIEAERCAIKVYKDLLNVLDDQYPKLKKDLIFILKEEEEHELDLLKILKKINY
ncbi:ferritin [Candidatus Dependentiae bacterium]|nr:ferritin [Candidatus Dependentiae bacterium]